MVESRSKVSGIRFIPPKLKLKVSFKVVFPTESILLLDDSFRTDDFTRNLELESNRLKN